MHIVIFAHPTFLNSSSMPKYVNMISEGLEARDHAVEVWTAKGIFHSMPGPRIFKKWLGYIDQFILFPIGIKKRLRKVPTNTLFVFADHALGPWVSLIANRPHIIHCHDFLAQRSALGELPENNVKFTGKLYQKYIRKGYRCGKNFISISQKTQRDLHRLLITSPQISEVVYNGLNQNFEPGNPLKSAKFLENALNLDLQEGYILHVGGNQFYKNRKGVIKIYEALRKSTFKAPKLLMVGPQPTNELVKKHQNSAFASDIHFLIDLSDEFLKLAYQGATVLLFPSLEEGFGWPIAEAMASGCPVVTTGWAPMNEVGGDSCYYIPRYEGEFTEENWSLNCAEVLNKLLDLSPEERGKLIELGVAKAKSFDTEETINRIESLYSKVLNEYTA